MKKYAYQEMLSDKDVSFLIAATLPEMEDESFADMIGDSGVDCSPAAESWN